MESLLECVPNFAFVGEDLEVFEFPKYHVYLLKTEARTEIWVRGKGPKSLTQNLPQDCRVISKSLKQLGQAYHDGEETRLSMFAKWVPVAQMLIKYSEGEEVFRGVSFEEGVSDQNIGDLLFEGTTPDWMASPRKALAQELLGN